MFGIELLIGYARPIEGMEVFPLIDISICCPIVFPPFFAALTTALFGLCILLEADASSSLLA